jgi:hypothetical protein
MNILTACRDARDGAYIRTANGDSIGDDAFSDVVFDSAMALHAETGIPFRRLRAALWRAANVGADRAHKDMAA